jgi:hypothetical protein
VKKDDEGNPCSSDDAKQVEVLMISTPNRADMVFPKVTAATISIRSVQQTGFCSVKSQHAVL